MCRWLSFKAAPRVRALPASRSAVAVCDAIPLLRSRWRAATAGSVRQTAARSVLTAMRERRRPVIKQDCSRKEVVEAAELGVIAVITE